MDRHAQARLWAWPEPWTSIFATRELWKLITAFVEAPRFHGQCYACIQTDMGNLRSLGRFLLCSSDIAGRDDGECLCRHCGQSVKVPQTLFTRLAEAKRAWRDRWDRSVMIQACIYREASCKTDLAEITQYRYGMSPRTRAWFYADMTMQLRRCSGNPLDHYEESDTPTDSS